MQQSIASRAISIFGVFSIRPHIEFEPSKITITSSAAPDPAVARSTMQTTSAKCETRIIIGFSGFWTLKAQSPNLYRGGEPLAPFKRAGREGGRSVMSLGSRLAANGRVPDHSGPEYHGSTIGAEGKSSPKEIDLANQRRRHPMAGAMTIALALLLQTSPANALVLPDDVQAKLDKRIDSFVDANGFTRVNPRSLEKNWYTRKRFPNPDTSTIFRADAGINAATKAIMLVQSREPELPVVRYRVLYRLESTPDFGGDPHAFVEVTRFNLGPVLYRETRASTPDGVPVSKKGFGVGSPSVVWRFVAAWRQSPIASFEWASRKVLTEEEAKAMDCLDVSCLSSVDPRGTGGDWRKIRPPKAKPAPYVTMKHNRLTAPRISDLLFQEANGDRMEPVPANTNVPQLTFVISMEIEGQDPPADGLLHQGQLRDDAISDIWTRCIDMGGNRVEWRQLVQHYPGRN